MASIPMLEGRTRLPVICSPMFLVSFPELVMAQCKAGVVGSFPALNARPESELERWIVAIRQELDAYQREHPGRVVAPFAVNQVLSPGNERAYRDIETCVRLQVPITITSLRAPNEVVQEIHRYGGIILHDVVNFRHAMKALEAGVDGLVLVAGGAGGHAGRLNPIALVNEIRKAYDGPLVLSGAITTGSGILAAQAMGADYAYMGTRFIATRESHAGEAYKQAIVRGKAADVIYTDYFTGVHGNYLRESIAAAGLDPDNLPVTEAARTGMPRVDAQGVKAWKDIWGVGQGIGTIDDVPDVATLVDRLEAEYRAARARLF
ncbi:MAG: nitronate monooxygenase [Alicycliphilus denitrificans]|nr:nitronate monooxygenase [Alicycliphilus denitrificans]